MVLFDWKSGYKIHMDLCGDYSNMIRSWLKQRGIQTKANKEWDLWYGYFNLNKKLIRPRKRRVWYSKEFLCPEENQKGLNLLVEKFELGEDVSSYLNKTSDKPEKFDLLLYDWGIHHFHLGEKKEKDSKYVERTGPVLFAKVDDNNAYFIQIYRHGKNVTEQPWNKQEMIRILYENWPWCIEQYHMPDVLKMTKKVSDRMHEQLRKNGMLTFVEVKEGAVYAPMGGGYASSGHSEEIVLLCDRIHNTLKLAELKIRDNLESCIRHIEESTQKRIDRELRFILWDSGEGFFYVVELESQVAIMKVAI